MKLIKTTCFCFLFILIACEPEINDFHPYRGEADFRSYVALGNSLTAGYQDGALYREGQLNSYPRMLARQFESVGGSNFKQPLVFDNAGIGFTNGSKAAPKLILKSQRDCRNEQIITPKRLFDTALGPENLRSIGDAGPYNNMGVPGARVFDLLSTSLGNFFGGNPFYARFASDPGNSTVISDAMANEPTFFTLWIGNNDVLGYALSGGDNSPFPDSITAQSTFHFHFDLMTRVLVEYGAQGVLANIPDISTIPYFTTIPYNGLTMSAATARDLNDALRQRGYNHISFNEGKNPYIIEDLDAPKGIRQLKKGELLLLALPQDSLKCGNWGSFDLSTNKLKPVPHYFVLDDEEMTKIQQAVDGFNLIIRNTANKYNLPVADMNTLMKEVSSGVVYNGANLSGEFVSGGVFSLDGVHPNPRGYALVANEFIQTINDFYHARVPLVQLTDYRSVIFP